MTRIIVIGLMAAMFSTFALGQSLPPSPDSQVTTKKKGQQPRSNVSAQCPAGQKQCNGLGGHGATLLTCCKANETCGQSFDGFPFCK
jgi:hypothetical protein